MFYTVRACLWLLALAGCESFREGLVYLVVLISWTWLLREVSHHATADLIAGAAMDRMTPSGFFSTKDGGIRRFGDSHLEAKKKVRLAALRAACLDILLLVGLGVAVVVSWLP